MASKTATSTVSAYMSPPLFIYRKYTTSAGTTMKNSGNLQEFPIDSLTERIGYNCYFAVLQLVTHCENRFCVIV